MIIFDFSLLQFVFQISIWARRIRYPSRLSDKEDIMRFSMHGGRASRALRASLGVPCHLMKHSHVGRDVFCYFLFFVPPPPNTWALLRDYTRQVVALHEACGWHDMGLVADITLVMPWLFVHVDRTYRCWHVFGDCRCLSCIKLIGGETLYVRTGKWTKWTKKAKKKGREERGFGNY